jgi:hypothetical protein
MGLRVPASADPPPLRGPLRARPDPRPSSPPQDPDAPKRALGAYMLFSQAKRGEVRARAVGPERALAVRPRSLWRTPAGRARPGARSRRADEGPLVPRPNRRSRPRTPAWV